MINFDKIKEASGGMPLIEWQQETLLFLDTQYTINDKPINQPTLGSVVLLDLLQNPLIAGGELQDIDIIEAFFILQNGEEAKNYANNIIEFKADKKEFLKEFFDFKKTTEILALKVIILKYFEFLSHGFEMLPEEPKGVEIFNRPITYDSEFIISYIDAVRSITGLDYHYILWQYPFISGGFALAKCAKNNGIKNVERKFFDLKEMTKKAKEMLYKDDDK